MAKKISKALRGKRRWIGCNCTGFNSRKEVENFLSDLPVKLYDFENDKCIIVVQLEQYENVKQKLSSEPIISVTSSGKIRLVRERMNFSRKPRKR